MKNKTAVLGALRTFRVFFGKNADDIIHIHTYYAVQSSANHNLCLKPPHIARSINSVCTYGFSTLATAANESQQGRNAIIP